MRKILVVDDDPTIHQLISAIAQTIGQLTVEVAFNGYEAYEKAKILMPDLVVADIVMPDMDGLELCSRLRNHVSLGDVPILLLTARSDVQDKYHGFLQGADDYLIKPFDAMELQLRMKALLRRAGRKSAEASADGYLRAGTLTLNTHRYMAEHEGKQVRLTASEFAIMRYLVEHAEQVVSVDALLTRALDYPPRVGNPQVIHTHMKNIRQKFRAAGIEPDFLTSSRRGYLLLASSGMDIL